jgi:hypothetical protein
MPSWNHSPSYLITLAAEGIASAVAGCARVLSVQQAGNAAAVTDVLRMKGINYFGPRIIDRWKTELSPLEPEVQIAALVQLADVTGAECRQQATSIVETQAGSAAVEDRSLAIEYLMAIPLTIRRSLVPDPATGRRTIAPTFARNDTGTLIRLLPVDVPPFPLGAVVPGTSYHLEELLGMGGFGAVYKACNRFEQNQPPRAIKFCLDPSMVTSLHHERAILDRMMTVAGTTWSDRIVRLYGYALDVQPPFLVYEYVPGGDLTSYLMAVRQKTGRGFRPDVVLELVRQVAEALAFAHGQGLVHRDLKPANILVSNASIKLTDFGIGGAAITQMRGGTVTASLISQMNAAEQATLFRGSGTPLYMSPEQRRGESPDPRQDLFSLGVVWYQLLMGDVTRELSPGWQDELTEEFQAPTTHIELIQRCVGYFKKRPAHAGELLAMLPPADSGDKPEAVGARTTKIARGEIACFAEHAGSVRSVVITADGRRALSAGDDTTIRVWDLENRRSLYQLEGHTEAIMGMAVAADSRRALSGGRDGTLRFWDLANGRLVHALEAGWDAVLCVALAPDGSRVLFATDDYAVHLWDLRSRQEIYRFAGHTDSIRSVALAADCRRAISAGADHTLRLWDLDGGKEKHQFEGHTDAVVSVAISPNGRWCISGSADQTARLWDVESGRMLRTLDGHGAWVNAVAIGPTGRRVLTGSGGKLAGGEFRSGADSTIRLWDVTDGKELRSLEGHGGSVTSVAFSADGRYALSGSLDKTVRLWDLSG